MVLNCLQAGTAITYEFACKEAATEAASSRPDCALDQALHISLVSHRVYLACGASAQKRGTAGLLLAPR